VGNGPADETADRKYAEPQELTSHGHLGAVRFSVDSREPDSSSGLDSGEGRTRYFF